MTPGAPLEDPAAEPGVRAAIYTRISREHDEGLGVARQEYECRRLTDRISVTVHGIYSDDDYSAYSGKPRPAYERLLADIEHGAVNLVVSWHPDRLYRRHQDLIRFVDTVNAAHAQVATVISGPLDLSTASGRMVARVIGAVAQHECDQQAERLRLKHHELAELGRWGGGRRPYGYRPTGHGMLEVVPSEAAVIREAADRILHGDTIRAVARDLNRRDIPAWSGGAWGDSSLPRILTSPTVCGLRVRHGSVSGPAVWARILDEATVDLLKLVLANSPGRKRGPSRTALLNPTLIFCGRCGAPLHSRGQGNGRMYRCLGSDSSTACGRLFIVAPNAENAIRAAVIARLSRRQLPRLEAATAPDVDLVRRLCVVLEARLRQLAAAYTSRQLTRSEWEAARQLLLRALERAKADLATRRWKAALDRALAGPNPSTDLWRQWPLADQQDLVESLIERVTVNPGGSPGGRFDRNRILDGTLWRR